MDDMRNVIVKTSRSARHSGIAVSHASAKYSSRLERTSVG